MKKYNVILIALAVFSIIATCVYSSVTIDSNAPYSFGTNNTFTPSSSVTVIGLASTTSYSANSRHLNGDREFGATSTDTRIFWETVTPGTAAPATPTVSDSSEYTGWSKL